MPSLPEHFDAPVADETHAGRQAGDAGQIHGSRFVTDRQSGGMQRTFALHPGSPDHDLLQPVVRHDQHAGSRRPEQSLVSRGDDEHPAGQPPVVQADRPRALRGVDQQRNIEVGGEPGDFLDRLDASGHVRGLRHRHELRVRPRGRQQIRRVDSPVGLRLNVRHADAVAATQVLQRAEDGVVLQFGRHDVGVRTRPQVALDHEVQRVRGRGSQDHAGGIGYTEQTGQFLATRPCRIGGAAGATRLGRRIGQRRRQRRPARPGAWERSWRRCSGRSRTTRVSSPDVVHGDEIASRRPGSLAEKLAADRGRNEQSSNLPFYLIPDRPVSFFRPASTRL